jgi:hypothetical protein
MIAHVNVRVTLVVEVLPTGTVKNRTVGVLAGVAGDGLSLPERSSGVG